MQSSSLTSSSYSPSLTRQTTLLICFKSLTEKYKMALQQNIPIVTPQYIYTSMKARKWLAWEAYRCPALYGLKVSCTGFGEDERIILQRNVEAGGGEFHPSLIRNETTHLLVEKGAEQSPKANAALQWGGIRVVRENWVRESVAQGWGLDEEAYEVVELMGEAQRIKKEMKQKSASLSNTSTSGGGVDTAANRSQSTDWLHQHRQPDDLDMNMEDTSTQESKLPVRHILDPLPAGWRPDIASPSNESSNETANVPPSTHPDAQVHQHNPRSVYIRDLFSPDHFLLEKCTVFLIGFNEYPAVLQRTVQLLSHHGAVRLPHLIPHRLTHIIVYKPTSDELIKLQNSFLLSDLGISVVMYRWLEDSIQEGVLLNESEYLFL